MKKCLVIAACLAFILLPGCNRRGMWDWYPACDLVEGQAERRCGPCVPRNCRPGQVVRTEIAVPMDAPTEPLPAPVIVDEVVEEAPK